jgi:hypothetical protein
LRQRPPYAQHGAEVAALTARGNRSAVDFHEPFREREGGAVVGSRLERLEDPQQMLRVDAGAGNVREKSGCP